MNSAMENSLLVAEAESRGVRSQAPYNSRQALILNVGGNQKIGRFRWLALGHIS
jgi:hypothetical protein